MRYVAARDALAMKGVTTKPKENQITQQAMVFNFSGPVSQSGAPILPFSNAAPTLPAKLDTVETAPTLQSATNETEPKK
jgi:hypothetical protein